MCMCKYLQLTWGHISEKKNDSPSLRCHESIATPELGMGYHGPSSIHTEFPACFDLSEATFQLLWAHECNDHAMSGSTQCFLVLFPILWLVYSFCLPCSLSIVGLYIDVSLRDEHPKSCDLSTLSSWESALTAAHCRRTLLWRPRWLFSCYQHST